jgi:Fe-S cluster biosynthesis and repair protein YggX
VSEPAGWACRRCGRGGPPLAAPPFPGPLGRELQAAACAACWEEWRQTEVRLINELRLDFMDPAAQEVLQRYLREFFLLDAAPGAAPGPAAGEPAP